MTVAYHRHDIRDAFLILKRRRGIGTRYAKTSDGFIAAAQVCYVAICANILV